MSDENIKYMDVKSEPVTSVPETSDGKRARAHRGQVYSILEELVDAMELARAEGFIVQFTIPQGPDGANQIDPANLAIMKKW